MPKADKATSAARIEEILRIRLDGAEYWDICEYVREKSTDPESPWHGEKPLSQAQIYRYIRKSDQLIAESCRASRGKLLRRHLAQRRNLYAKSLAAGDIRTALSVLADEARLLHLYEDRELKKSPPIQIHNTPKEALSFLGQQLARVQQLPIPETEKISLILAISKTMLDCSKDWYVGLKDPRLGPRVVEIHVPGGRKTMMRIGMRIKAILW